MSQKLLRSVIAQVLEGNAWKKLTNPPVAWARWPILALQPTCNASAFALTMMAKSLLIMLNIINYQLQPNAGDDIPSAVKKWRAANGGTHAVMANVYVKKDGKKEDVEESLKAAFSKVKGV